MKSEALTMRDDISPILESFSNASFTSATSRFSWRSYLEISSLYTDLPNIGVFTFMLSQPMIPQNISSSRLALEPKAYGFDPLARAVRWARRCHACSAAAILLSSGSFIRMISVIGLANEMRVPTSVL